MSNLRRPPERYAMPERRKTARGVPELTALESSMVARIRALEAERDELIEALADACTLLDGWINTKCPPRYREEHRADLAQKRALLTKHTEKS